MIVWIDGAFGSGKTTLVAELHRQWRRHSCSTPSKSATSWAWGTAQIRRCATARAMLPSDTLVLDGCLPVAELAAEVMAVRPPAAEGARRPPA